MTIPADQLPMPTDGSSQAFPHGVIVAVTTTAMLLSAVAAFVLARQASSLALVFGAVLLAATAVAMRLAMKTAGPAMRGALGALRASAALEPRIHNRWTTHATWEMRVARIRAYAAGAADGRP
jgi:hypothetical protein